MNSECTQQIIETAETDVKARPSAAEFETAYQGRVAIDRIRFAIKHTEQFARQSDQSHEAGLQLMDALDRLEALDRHFQARSKIGSLQRNGCETEPRT